MGVTWSEIHEELKMVLMAPEVEQKRAQAQQIETILRILKQKQKIGEQAIDGVSGIILDEIRRTANNILKFKSDMPLFNRPHNRIQRSGADDIVEAELAAVIASIQNKGLGGKMSYTDFLGGRDPVTVYSEEIIKEGSSRIGRAMANHVASKLPEAKKIVSRSQKTDVKGLQAVETINAELGPEYQKLVQLFSGVSFTVKNYSSVFEVDSLNLGQTNPEKAIRGSLYYLGYKQNIDEVFSAIMSSSENLEHAGHLQFAYELAGWGQGTGAGKNFVALPEVDFLVYNDPAVPESIAVRSTKAIIYDKVFNNKNMGASMNRISKAYFEMKESGYKRQLRKK